MCTIQTKTFPNLNKNENIVNHNVWVVDETYLTPQKVLFLVTNLKTRAILGYSFKHFKNKGFNNQPSSKTGLNSQEILIKLFRLNGIFRRFSCFFKFFFKKHFLK
uniref:Uncharacterized protein n=1 Tax=Halimeda discoidea TaxID=118222 RepID=A0A1C9JB81_9CHLO|nr:hypothetical protein [Halimeda discoidea]